MRRRRLRDSISVPPAGGDLMTWPTKVRTAQTVACCVQIYIGGVFADGLDKVAIVDNKERLWLRSQANYKLLSYRHLNTEPLTFVKCYFSVCW
jgi:hypothetical protein